MMTGASRPFAALRSPVAPLNETSTLQRSLAIDQMRDELDVVDAVRVAAVDRRIGRRPCP